MSEDTFVSRLPENEQNPLVADALTQTPDVPAGDRPAPEQTLEQYEAEMDRLAKDAEEEAARLAQEMTESLPIEPDEDEYTPEDYERDIEFGRLEAAREEHFTMLRRTDEAGPKYLKHKYLVEGLMPANEIHVFAGASGIGKSTILFDFISKWQREEPVFGRKTNWFPYVIFSNDRSKAGIMRSLERLKLNPQQFNIVDTITSKDDQSMADIIEAYHEANPHLKVVFIEGMHVGQKDGNDYGEGSANMKALNRVCQKFGITIIGTTHSSKTATQKGQATRESIIGSVANGGMCETIFAFAKGKANRVKLNILPRQEAPITLEYEWLDGKLVPAQPEKEEQKPIVKFLNELDSAQFKTKDAIAYFKKHRLGGYKTAQRGLKEAEEEGWIDRIFDDQTGKEKKGHWQKI